MGRFEAFLGVNPWTALFTLLNFIALFLVLKKFLWGPVMKMIADRQKEIDDLYADAGEAKEQAQQLRSRYEEEIANAQQTGDQIVKDAVARGQRREEEILRQANEEADAIRRKAQEDIERDKKKAVDDAKGEIAGLALDIAGKVVGQSMNDDAHAELVDQFIDQLGEGV